MSWSQMFAAYPVLPGIGEALLHFVWQGALVALLLACAQPFLRRQSANARYLAACGALLLMMALPVLTLWQSAGGSAAAGAPEALARDRAAAGAGEELLIVVRPLASQALSAPVVRESVLPWLVLFWLAGILVLSLRFCGGWLLVHRFRRTGVRAVAPLWRSTVARMAREVGIRRPVRILESSLAQVPMVIGWLRPVILLPAAALTGLTPQQLEAILAHELAHVRRNDYWMNLVQAAAEILLFYHPAVWWVSNRIRIEREHCCDDMGVAACGDRLTYARALVLMEELRSLPGAPSLSLALDGSPLLQRVRRLFEAPPPGPGGSARWAAGLLLAAGALTIALGAGVAWAGAPQPPAPPAPPAAPAAPAAKDRVAEMSEERIALLIRRGLDRGLVEQLRQAGDREVSLDEIRGWQSQGMNPRLADELGALGHRSLTVDQLLSLVGFGVDDRFIRELRGIGYQKLSVDELIRMGRYGVDAGFVSAWSKAGYPGLSVDDLTLLGRYEVDAAFAQSLQAAGYRNLSAEDLASLKRYEVDAGYVEEINAAGYRDLPVDDLLALRRYNVDGELLRKIVASGTSKPTISQVLEAARYGRRD